MRYIDYGVPYTYTYVPVYVEADSTDDGYTTGRAPQPSPQAGEQKPEVTEAPIDEEPSIPDGVAVPRPLVVPEVAPEVLPLEEEDDSSNEVKDQADASQTDPSRAAVGPAGT